MNGEAGKRTPGWRGNQCRKDGAEMETRRVFFPRDQQREQSVHLATRICESYEIFTVWRLNGKSREGGGVIPTFPLQKWSKTQM